MGCAGTKYDGTLSSTRKALARGEITEALAHYEAEGEKAEREANWADAYVAYREASRAARFSGQAQKMIAYAEKSLEMAIKIKSLLARLNAIDNLLLAQRFVRNYPKVVELANQGLTLAGTFRSNSSEGYAWEAIFYSYLGGEYLRTRHYDEAIEARRSAVTMYQVYLTSVSRVRAGGSPNSMPDSMLNPVDAARGTFLNHIVSLATTYTRAGKLAEALAQYQQAFDYIRQWRFNYAEEGNLFEGIGEINYRHNRYSEALDNFTKALEFSERRHQITDSIRRSRWMGDTLRKLGNESESTKYYQKSILQIESTRALLQNQNYRQSYFGGDIATYVNMIDTLIETDQGPEAFDYGERARSRVFLDTLGNKAKLARASSANEELALRQRINALRARAGNADGETDNDARRQLDETLKLYESVLARVKKENAEQASLMSVEPLTAKQVQGMLDANVTMIEYFVSTDKIFIWVIDKEHIEAIEKKQTRRSLLTQINGFRKAISELEEGAGVQKRARVLFNSLIGPVLPHIHGKELIIVPHDVLHYLPFQALLAPDGQYLIEKYPISYLSSASLMQFTQEKRKARGDLTTLLANHGKVLTFGNPDLGDVRMNLSFAEVEAKEIKSLYPQSTVYLEKEATEEMVKTLIGNSDIVHFASHAELSEEDPLASAIRLAKSDKEDGRLEVREIFGMDLKASLVVLSACETGLGKLSSGDELVGLTRAFIYAGTPSVVASLWNVEDSSTAQLMASFYKNLKTMTKVEALRQAQLELIRSNINSDLLARRGIGGVGKLGETPSATAAPRAERSAPGAISVTTSHPYFWAPFILVGEGK